MQKLIATALVALFAAGAYAQTAAPAKAEAKAVGKDGKPLAGAAKAAFMKKCEKDAGVAPAATAAPAKADCEAKAVSKDGKPLAGAAKTAFMKKCEKDAAAKK